VAVHDLMLMCVTNNFNNHWASERVK